MGSASSSTSSVKARNVGRQSMASTNSDALSSEEARGSPQIFPSSNKHEHEIINESTTAHPHESVADEDKLMNDNKHSQESNVALGGEINDTVSKNLPAENSTAVKKEEIETISSTELEKMMIKLGLSDLDTQTVLKMFLQHPRLGDHMKTGGECILSFKSSSYNDCLDNVKKLDMLFFDMNIEERTTMGDFLSCLNFGKDSYRKYVSCLKVQNADNFSDSLLENCEKSDIVIIQILWSIRSLWWNFSDASTLFGAQLVSDIGIIEELIHNINSLTGVKGNELKYSFTFESTLGILHNLAKLPGSRQTFRKMNLVDILAKFLNYKDQPKATMLVLMVLSLIIDENQTHLLISHDSVFDLMLSLTKQAIKAADHRYDGFSIEELLQAMTGLSRNDSVKKVLVQKGILKILPDLLTAGQETEMEESVKLLWELSFDPENKILIETNEAIMQAVSNLSKHGNKKTAKAAQGVLWVIGMEKGKEIPDVELKKKKNTKPVKASIGHVMLSYNWSDQKILLEIREFLKSHGYKIWMDIDSIHGSTLQAMAEAVEQAAVVLICMSEKYKESPNCRSEAEYAFHLHKPIIPLLMQSEYKPDGWLGILLGTKIFFNFSGKYTFEKKINELVREIGDRGKIIDIPSKDNTDGPIIKTENRTFGKPPDTKPPIKFDVINWIKENSLTEFVNLQALSTEHLCFLKKVSLRAPEFYYSFMVDFMSGKTSPEDLTRLMLVTNALENVPR